MIVESSFSLADDLLGAAQAGKLSSKGPIFVSVVERIGPLVEIVSASRCFPEQYSQVELRSPLVPFVLGAIEREVASGKAFGSMEGVFPLSQKEERDGELWDQWALRAQLSAQKIGFSKQFSQALIGALVEFADNVTLHSEAISTGIALYSARRGAFEFSISDRGIGILASLRQNPDFAALKDDGEAILAAIADGNSRFNKTTNHGYGIGQAFRALAGYDGELRFRSGTCSFTVSGRSPTLQGQTKLVSTSFLQGFSATVLCRLPS